MEKQLLLLAVLIGVLSRVSADAPAGYYRVQAELLQLQNPLGIRHDGKPCDRLGVCDPVIKVFLDTERPLSAFPGPRYISQYTKIFTATDVNEPIINKNRPYNVKELKRYAENHAKIASQLRSVPFRVGVIPSVNGSLFLFGCNTVSSDICGQPFSKANLRCYVKDDDSFLRGTDDHISDFDCVFSPTPAADEASAQWSKGEPCSGHYQPGKIKMWYRYRVFTIPAEQCQPTPPPTG